jgi:hypothetical protein
MVGHYLEMYFSCKMFLPIGTIEPDDTSEAVRDLQGITHAAAPAQLCTWAGSTMV